MPLNTDLNISPYFDDFDETKQFHRILFRPATAIQARELTQLQSILQNQIERFGNWAFRNGDIVYGCTINDIPIMPFVRLDDFAVNGSSFSTSDLQFTRVVSATSNLQARVIVGTDGISYNYPNTNVIYVQYINTGIDGETVFSNTDQLNFYKIPLTGNSAVDNVATINVYSNGTGQVSIGNGHGISVSDGVVFINGNFVKVNNTSYGVVNSFGVFAGNTVVGFQAVETIVTENVDPSLEDNALGYPNENAPGAHRLKIVPVLTALDPVTASNTVGFNPIAAYSYGAMVRKQTQDDVHQTINKALATRVYEESGNFVVNPFTVDVISDTGDAFVNPATSNNVLVKINPGLGYSQGYRVNLDKSAYVNMRRGTDTKTHKNQFINFDYGSYFKLNETAGTFNFSNSETVYLYSSNLQAVTTRKFTSWSPPSNPTTNTFVLGTARAKCFSYAGGSPAGTNNAIFYLHVFDIKLKKDAKLSDVKSVYANTSGGNVIGVGDLYSPGLQAVSKQKQIFSFGTTGVKNIRDESNNNVTEYIYRTQATSNLGVDGKIVITLPASATGGLDQLPYGVGQLADSAAQEISVFTTANGDVSLSGLAVTYTDSGNVIGLSTSFTTNFAIGDIIKVGSEYRTVASISNNTYMVVDKPFVTSTYPAGASYVKHLPAGKQISMSQYLQGAPAYVVITAADSFTIFTSQTPNSVIPVSVDYNVLRTQAVPSKKVIKRNRYVTIDTTTNPYGPWCLGFSDIHNVNAVYAGIIGAKYSKDNPDITNMFSFDTGQKDTHYDLGYLYLKPGQTVLPYPFLLVDLDYFAANTTPGIGFFTVESYPIDDANTANTNAIQTKDIPLLVDSSGLKYNLRDVIDFRPVVNNTAADATTIETATENPSSNTSFTVPASGSHVPAYGKYLQADYTHYLPRIDLVYMTPDNILKTKEGVADLLPATPFHPQNALVLAEVNVPAYPSLSSDQINDLIKVNAKCINQCRDLSNRVTVNLVSNKRYTMSDIGKIEGRISKLEYYTQLSLLQQQTKDLTVTDANGLNRFKNGIFVEPFNDFSLADVSNPEYSMAIDQTTGVGRPKFRREVIRIQFNNVQSTNVQKTGRLITLPYTTAKFISQPMATKYRSSAHVAFAWNGTMVLFPTLLNQFNIYNGGTVNMTVDLASPWQQFASSPFAYNWGGWRSSTNTSVSTASSSTLSGQAQTYNVDIWLGRQTEASLNQTMVNLGAYEAPGSTNMNYYNLLQASGVFAGGAPSADFVTGSTTFNYLSDQSGVIPGQPAGTLDAAKAFWNASQLPDATRWR